MKKDNIVIEINNLKKYYGKIRGVEDVSLKINSGEVYGFIGPNGAGKSTTIRILMGLINKTSGEVFLNGKELDINDVLIKKEIGYLPSEINLYDDLTVKEILDYHESFYDKNVNKRRKELVKLFLLDESKKIEDLSLGNSKKLGIDESLFDKVDIHIHVPEGAVPKDGPSAGVTMATAIVSALTNEPVRNDVAMTGEITLRGNVLPIGGLKEKSISAHRAGIKTIVIPRENEKDLDEVPDVVKENLNIIFADKIDDVLQVALVNSGNNHVSIQN